MQDSGLSDRWEDVNSNYITISIFYFTILENNYQEEKCLDVIEQMRQCCINWKSVSLCCEGIDIEKNYNPTKKDPASEKTSSEWKKDPEGEKN